MKPFEFISARIQLEIASAADLVRGCPIDRPSSGEVDESTINALFSSDRGERERAAIVIRSAGSLSEGVLKRVFDAAFDHQDTIVRGILWSAIAEHWRDTPDSPQLISLTRDAFLRRFRIVPSAVISTACRAWLGTVEHVCSTAWHNVGMRWRHDRETEEWEQDCIEAFKSIVNSNGMPVGFINDESAPRRYAALAYFLSAPHEAEAIRVRIQEMAHNDPDDRVRLMAKSVAQALFH